MSIVAVVIICSLLFLLGFTTTAAMFCMRERNTANDRYNRLYEAWHNQVEEITNLQSDIAWAESQRDYWCDKYNDIVAPEPSKTSIAVPATKEGDVA